MTETVARLTAKRLTEDPFLGWSKASVSIIGDNKKVIRHITTFHRQQK